MARSLDAVLGGKVVYGMPVSHEVAVRWILDLCSAMTTQDRANIFTDDDEDLVRETRLLKITSCG